MYVPAWLIRVLAGISVGSLLAVIVFLHWYIHESHKRIRLMEQMARDLRRCSEKGEKR